MAKSVEDVHERERKWRGRSAKAEEKFLVPNNFGKVVIDKYKIIKKIIINIYIDIFCKDIITIYSFEQLLK